MTLIYFPVSITFSRRADSMFHLQKSKPQLYEGNMKHVRYPADDDEEDENTSGCCSNKKLCWWAPRQNTLPVAFCNETSIHGFKFLGQEKRHISERIFWLVGFLSSLGLAIYLIKELYSRFQHVPVIVSFQSKEVDMDSVPFPAVTLCNMNKFPRSKVEELQRIAEIPFHPDNLMAKKELLFVHNTCNAQQSFAKKFHYAYKRGQTEEIDFEELANGTELTANDLRNMTDFIIRNTLPCDQLLRLCRLGERKRDCGELFKPIITDYGKCCVFNILPLPLLLRNPANEGNDNDSALYDNAVLGSDARKHWPLELIKEWKKWNYEDGFKLGPKSKYPWRQKRAGLPYGLSFLIDPNTDEYFCPASDSIGTRFIMHSPLEMPHVMEFSSVAHLNREILIEVHPDVTNAEKDIRNVDKEHRMCYFGREKALRFFGPYTGGNCVDECTARLLTRICGCTLFDLPREAGVGICASDPHSDDYNCTEQARLYLQENIDAECKDCDPLCEDVAYNYETTIVTLQSYKELWEKPDPKNYSKPPDWAAHKMSMVHIFFGTETTVPKLRKRLYQTTDLIADTGGILGLCLGFSVLSLVELFYFLTLRAFWTFCRKRRLRKQEAVQQDNQRTNNFLQQLLFQKHQSTKVIQLNPTVISVYPRDMAVKTVKRKWGNAQGHHFYGAKSFQQKGHINSNYDAIGGYNY